MTTGELILFQHSAQPIFCDTDAITDKNWNSWHSFSVKKQAPASLLEKICNSMALKQAKKQKWKGGLYLKILLVKTPPCQYKLFWGGTQR